MQRIAALHPDPRLLLRPCVFAVPSFDGEAMETTRRIVILVAVQKLRLHTSPCARDGAAEIANSAGDAGGKASRYREGVILAVLVGEVDFWTSPTVARGSNLDPGPRSTLLCTEFTPHSCR